MAPMATVGLGAAAPQKVVDAVLGQSALSDPEPAPPARGTVDSATATPTAARLPTVISSVPGTEYWAASPVSLRSRLGSPREADAPRRGRRGR